MNFKSPIVIFVKPKASGNIGALARVLSNFDAVELRLVGSEELDGHDDAFDSIDWALSCRGRPILEKARWYPSLRDAQEGIHISIGTSGRTEGFEKGFERPLRDPSSCFQSLSERLGQNPELSWALVMGTEDDGLSAEEAGLCQELIHIPTSETNSSMNIAMACGVLLYHWRLLQMGMIPNTNNESKGAVTSASPFYDPNSLDSTKSERSDRKRFADQAEKEKWIDYLFTILEKTQLFKYPDREALRARIRRWLQSGDIPVGELLFAFEILYQIKSWGSGSYDKRDFLKE